MSDPLSITASIAGLITLAQTLIPLLSNFVQDVQEYPKEFREVVEEVRGLCGILHAIRPVIERLETQTTSPGAITSSREGMDRAFWGVPNMVRWYHSFTWATRGLPKSFTRLRKFAQPVQPKDEGEYHKRFEGIKICFEDGQ